MALVGCLTVGLGAGMIVWAARSNELGVDPIERSLVARLEDGGFATAFSQGTDHPSGVPPDLRGQRWHQSAGTWGTLASSAYVSAPPCCSDPASRDESRTSSRADSLLLADLGTDGTAEVVLEQVHPGAGLAFRAVDPSNYLGFVVSPDATGWELVRVVDGVPAFDPIEGPPPRDGVIVGARFEGTTLELSVDLVVVATVISDEQGSRVGLVLRGASGSGRDGARFDDFLANPPVGTES